MVDHLLQAVEDYLRFLGAPGPLPPVSHLELGRSEPLPFQCRARCWDDPLAGDDEEDEDLLPAGLRRPEPVTMTIRKHTSVGKTEVILAELSLMMERHYHGW